MVLYILHDLCRSIQWIGQKARATSLNFKITSSLKHICDHCYVFSLFGICVMHGIHMPLSNHQLILLLGKVTDSERWDSCVAMEAKVSNNKNKNYVHVWFFMLRLFFFYGFNSSEQSQCNTIIPPLGEIVTY